MYADDTHLYFTFSSSEVNIIAAKVNNLMSDTQKWMITKYLKANNDKNCITIFGSKVNHQKISQNSMKILNEELSIEKKVETLKFVMDSNLNLECQINQFIKKPHITYTNSGK